MVVAHSIRGWVPDVRGADRARHPACPARTVCNRCCVELKIHRGAAAKTSRGPDGPCSRDGAPPQQATAAFRLAACRKRRLQISRRWLLIPHRCIGTPSWGWTATSGGNLENERLLRGEADSSLLFCCQRSPSNAILSALARKLVSPGESGTMLQYGSNLTRSVEASAVSQITVGRIKNNFCSVSRGG